MATGEHREQVEVQATRISWPHVYLATVASEALDRIQGNDAEATIYDAMLVITFSVFTLEAYLNALGRELIPAWWEKTERSLNIRQKIRILHDRLGIAADFGSPPLQTVIQAVKTRHQLAHGRPQLAQRHEKDASKRGEPAPEPWPQTKWENDCANFEFAGRVLKDTKALILALHVLARQRTAAGQLSFYSVLTCSDPFESLGWGERLLTITITTEG